MRTGSLLKVLAITTVIGGSVVALAGWGRESHPDPEHVVACEHGKVPICHVDGDQCGGLGGDDGEKAHMETVCVPEDVARLLVSKGDYAGQCVPPSP